MSFPLASHEILVKVQKNVINKAIKKHPLHRDNKQNTEMNRHTLSLVSFVAVEGVVCEFLKAVLRVVLAVCRAGGRLCLGLPVSDANSQHQDQKHQTHNRTVPVLNGIRAEICN